MIELKLKTGEQFQVQPELIQSYMAAYKNIDVMEQLQIMQAWCLSNPSKRKTKRGILRFVNSWLSRASKEKPKAQLNGCDKQSTSYQPIETPVNTTTNPIQGLRQSRHCGVTR